VPHLSKGQLDGIWQLLVPKSYLHAKQLCKQAFAKIECRDYFAFDGVRNHAKNHLKLIKPLCRRSKETIISYTTIEKGSFLFHGLKGLSKAIES
jgi:hypothetical protein